MPKNQTKNQLKTLQLQLDQLDAQFKRALADYQNLEKRHHQNKENLIKFANQSLLDKLLFILDDLERAQTHLKNPGLDHIVKQFINILASEGIKEIKSTNQPFDPQLMDCAEVVAGRKNIVVATLLKGYSYHDKVLRPAKVEVGNGLLSKKLKTEKTN